MAQENSELTPQLCVIGGGAGGLAAAAAAAVMGAPVVLIEKGRMGGQSLNTGSVPSKALRAAAQHVNALGSGARLGVKSVRSETDFAAVSAHVRGAIAAIAPLQSAERFTELGVRVVAGTARFKDANAVTIGDLAIRARRFVVATGSSPFIPAIAGLSETPYLTPETIFDLNDCPRHLIIIGAGRIGLELAQTFRRLGADVTVLEAAVPLRQDDRECAQVVLDALAREGIRLHTGIQIAQVRRVPAHVQAVIAKAGDGRSEGEVTIEGSHLLLTAGRRPNVEDLDLDAAGIRHGPDGIMVDKRLRITNHNVYAIGDVIGGGKFAHAANHQAGLAIDGALFRRRAAIDHSAVPRIVFTDPELAQVGLPEDEARARHGAIRILRWPYRENDAAVTAAATDGHIKVIADRRGTILGATIVGAAASENITVWTLAIRQRLNIAALAGLVVPYPTYAEVGKRAAITYFMGGLTSPRVRRIIARLRHVG
jgi:pyruvate/2-oxoglutarate dehydrogenase complex dihydrolipoamide dehydrogenase (E3) component